MRAACSKESQSYVVNSFSPIAQTMNGQLRTAHAILTAVHISANPQHVGARRIVSRQCNVCTTLNQWGQQVFRQQRLQVAAAATGNDSSKGPSSSHGAKVGAEKWQKAVKNTLQTHFLPIALCSALLLGVTFPQLGLAAAKLHIPIVTTFGIFVIQVSQKFVFCANFVLQFRLQCCG